MIVKDTNCLVSIYAWTGQDMQAKDRDRIMCQGFAIHIDRTYNHGLPIQQ